MKHLSVVVAMAIVVASCSGSDSASPDVANSDESVSDTVTVSDTAPVSGSVPTETDGDASALDWGPCDTPNPLVETECATLVVPLDHADPDGEQIEIAVSRADTAGDAEQIGSIVFNPGGPGGSGVDFLLQAAAIMPTEVSSAFDLVGFDPRGVGASTAVECDVEVDDSVVLIAEVDMAAVDELFATQAADLASCTEQTMALAPHLGTLNAARDLDLLRAALGDDGLTYVGYSYGTRLGAVYAELFPDNVRALVLDAAVKPSTDPQELALGQAAGFDQALRNFAAACDADTDCLLHDVGPTLEVLDGLRSEIAEVGSFPVDDPDRMLTAGEFDLAVIASLYSKDTWPFLAQGLFTAEAEQDGTILQVLADAYSGRRPDGTYDNSQVANTFINCADDADRIDRDAIVAGAAEVAAQSEFFADALRASTGCLGFPESAEPLALGSADGAAPILVIGNTGDPATPYEWSVELAEVLSSATLYTVEAEGHTAYGTIECVEADVTAYLVDLVVPDDGSSCSDNADADFFVPMAESEVGLVISLFDCLRDNGADVPEISTADVLADPAGELLAESLDPTDPAFAAAALACTDVLLELQGSL
ncbi:alpha/beta hydrolase [Ilumatobacter coccineus]|nr:alpha/beta hydrolase [Ilumatobacter coccineus]